MFSGATDPLSLKPLRLAYAYCSAAALSILKIATGQPAGDDALVGLPNATLTRNEGSCQSFFRTLLGEG